jgi:hypothetical protein
MADFPALITACKAVDADAAAIEAWGKTLSKAVLQKNVIKNMAKIKADAAKTQADWKAGHYYTAGRDAGDIMKNALGPVVPKLSDTYYLQ